ncbi:ribulose-phosphate 3-epimerase [Shimazuella alba]|uniref:Ribulose-phosphate 3-epimerase n=1 Tax=Shimazuella alba TaxID=2690964 RepID=A0A6I4VP15_9BACL|nr:ribulose-phosphate 3-epimerase [Shimazuella alba]MXQ53307.1 ribulose-phosphate 3-epimerase [Shimazuella alba]
MVKIAPSLLSADFSRLKEEVQEIEQAGADWLHIDVMDGHFVPNISFGPLVVSAIRPHTSLPFDVHLMIKEPDAYIDAFVKSGADLITVHQETCSHLHRTITHIKDQGIKAGVAINPATSLSAIEPILPDVDLVLLMTVNPGFGGQSFIASVLPKIAELRTKIDNLGLSVEIEVDGGIATGTAKEVVENGATMLVAGSAVFGQKDRKKAIEDIRNDYRLKQV